jgi:hypothetical protein
MNRRVLVFGSRHWTDLLMIFRWLAAYSPDHWIVVEGGAPGADTLARLAALARGMVVWEYPADWDKHKKAAGPVRNRWMHDHSEPSAAMCFHDDPGLGSGSKDMAAYAEKKGTPVTILSHREKR